MLFTRAAARRAYSVPLLYLLFGAGMFAFSAVALLHASGGGQAFGAVMGLILGTGLVWLGFGSWRAIAARRERVVVTSLRKRVALERAACAFGVRWQPSSRSSSWVVFITDGDVGDDLGEWFSERGARRAVARLEGCLLQAPDPSNLRLARARERVASVERDWRERADSAQETVDGYYRSPAWRRAQYAVIGIVVVYLIAMLVYLGVTAR